MIGKLEASVYAASSGALGLVSAIHLPGVAKTTLLFLAVAWFAMTLVVYFSNGQIISSARKMIASAGFALGFAGIMVDLGVWVVS